ncbi:hypothetical protein BASA81_008329 [Batrachochytrium salamandrivorans]|nr:hypothetical protein BASA81_008329 [Batrachochytrium salamandrivorans]
MQYRRQSPYLLQQPRQMSFSNPNRHSHKSSYRCKLFLALVVFVAFGALFRNRENRFRPPTASTASIRQISMMEKADRIYQKYLAFNPTTGPSSSSPLEGSGGEEDLFNQLLISEQQNQQLDVGKSDDAGVIQQLLNEGVVEDPGLDHRPVSTAVEDDDVENTVVQDRTVILVEEEEDGDEASVVVSTQTKVSEQMSESSVKLVQGSTAAVGEEDDEEQDFINANSSSLFKPTHIKGHLNYKMVNNHFLSLMDAFKHAGWTKVQLDSSANLFLTKPVTPVVGSMGKMISQISKSSCLGGTKGGQLSCRAKFAQKLGCEFDSLKISPKQFDMWRSEDCNRFFDYALALPDKQWIGKVGASYHGRKITLYTGVTKHIKSSYGKCKMNQVTGGGYIMMEYISNPALLGGRKFDLRTFLLIADTKPFLVFYHKGFVRRSANAYSQNLKDKLAHITNVEEQGMGADHFLGFEDLQMQLTNELGFPTDFLQTKFEPRAKLVTNFVFQAARHSGLKRRSGAFGLFGLDWMIDLDQNIHLLEGNGNPVVQHYPGTGELTPKLWRDMALLLTRLHMDTKKLPLLGPLKQGFKFENGWELVFSELEELSKNHTYNACDPTLGDL